MTKSKGTGGLQCAVADAFAGVGYHKNTQGGNFHLEVTLKQAIWEPCRMAQ